MTILSVVPPGADPAVDGEALITVQCDVCCMPWIATSTLRSLRDAGWSLRIDGAALDVCHVDRRRLRPDQLVARPADGGAASRFPAAPADGGAWPNFFLIGAAKSATTSLHAFLDGHPDVAMAAGKELQYFQDPDRAGWAQHYRQQFPASSQVRGESSTAYTRAPFIPHVPGRIAALVPEARMVYVVRDPIERAVSSYVEERVHSNDLRSFDDAFSELDPELNPYVAGSCYARQLGLWLEHFPREQVLVLDMRDLAERPEDTVRRVWAFLGVDPDVPVGDLTDRLNARESKREYSGVVRRLRTSAIVRAAYRLPPGVRERLLSPVRQRLSAPIARPELTSDLRARLAGVFSSDAAELRRVTGLELADWPV